MFVAVVVVVVVLPARETSDCFLCMMLLFSIFAICRWRLRSSELRRRECCWFGVGVDEPVAGRGGAGEDDADVRAARGYA